MKKVYGVVAYTSSGAVDTSLYGHPDKMDDMIRSTMAKTKAMLISLKEWATKNGVSVRTAQRMARDGRLKTKKMVKHIVGVPADFRIKK